MEAAIITVRLQQVEFQLKKKRIMLLEYCNMKAKSIDLKRIFWEWAMMVITTLSRVAKEQETLIFDYCCCNYKE